MPTTLPRRLVHVLGAAAISLTLALSTAACSGADSGNARTAGEHQVTFTVDGHGSAALTWTASGAGSTPHTALPWHLTVPAAPTAHGVHLTVELDGHGGQATCAIAVDGRRLVSSLAQGAYGRAVCQTPPSSPGAQQADA